MLKRILVMLDGTAYGEVATRYAIELARANEAKVTGIVVIDEDMLGKGSHSMGIGSSYYAKKLRESREEQVDEEVDNILTEFSRSCSQAGVPMIDVRTRAHPEDALVEESKYHDLLVTGLRAHRRVGGGSQGHELLIKLTREGIIPTLAVGSSFQPIEHILFLYDGSVQSAKAIQMFVTSGLWSGVGGTVLTICDDGMEDFESAEAFNAEMAHYLDAHNRHCRRKVHTALDKEDVLAYASEIEADLIVMGSYGKSKVMQFFLGSMTKRLIQSSTLNLYLHH